MPTATTDLLLLDCETCRHQFHVRRSVASMVQVCPRCRHFVVPCEREVRQRVPWISSPPIKAPAVQPPTIGVAAIEKILDQRARQPSPVPVSPPPVVYRPAPQPLRYRPPTPQEQVFAGILSFARWLRFFAVSFVVMFVLLAVVCFLIGHFSY